MKTFRTGEQEIRPWILPSSCRTGDAMVRGLFRLATASKWRRLIVVGVAAVVTLAAWVRLGPIPRGLLDGIDTPSTVVVDRQGRVLYEVLSPDGSRARPLDAATLPPVLEAATLAAEDHRFYAHPGVDPVSLLRAVKHNLSEGQIVEGGSTITQQVAKLLIQRREGVQYRGFSMKVREMALALRLEHRFGKREILAMHGILPPTAIRPRARGARASSTSASTLPC